VLAAGATSGRQWWQHQ